MASAALSAGFGLDFETCDPEVFAAVVELLEEREQKRKLEEMRARLKERVGR